LGRKNKFQVNGEHAICQGLTENDVNFMEGIMAKNAKEKLLDDFHAVISDTEELMKSVSNESGGKTQALRAKIE
jgi:hypothetical protein